MVTERAKHIFQSVESDFKLNISTAWIDYEWALRHAIVKSYPNLVLKAFWYQFCLAIRRKCKMVPDFYETIWSNNPASSHFHQLLCLPLLKANDILEGFNILKQTVHGLVPMRAVSPSSVEKDQITFPLIGDCLENSARSTIMNL